MKEHEGVDVHLHSFLTSIVGGDEYPPVLSAYETGEYTTFLHLPGNESQLFSALQPAAASHYIQHWKQANDILEYGVSASAPGEPGTNCMSY